MYKKIVEVPSLNKRLIKLRKKKKIVLCHGTFDLLHIGHIKHFFEARQFGDILIVSVTTDNYVQKGPNRPAFNLHHRLEALSALDCIDYVVSSDSLNAVKILKEIKPHIYCKGPDYLKNQNDLTKQIYKEIQSLKSFGGKIKYTNDITFSSSKLLNNFFDTLQKTQKDFLNKISKNEIENFKDSLKNLSKKKVLVIGETIIDKYVFTEALGKSGKEPLLAFNELNEENYIGGAASIFLTIKNFVKRVNFLTVLGEDKKYKNYIEKTLSNKHSKIKYIYKKNSPTIVKKRYVDSLNKTKLFASYQVNDTKISKAEENEVLKYLNTELPKFDLVIVSDYGHGFITSNIASLISRKAKFLSLNTQINSSNIGFHSLNKYHKSDLIVINEKELRYELRDKDKDLKILIKKLSTVKKVKTVIVTSGSAGATLYNRTNNKFIFCPAFARKVIDKVGAGDSMLSIASLIKAFRFNDHFTLLAGSLAASNSVENISNSNTFDINKLLKLIQHLTK